MGINFAHLLLRSARASPERTALARGAVATATYAELAARVARLAGGLDAKLMHLLPHAGLIPCAVSPCERSNA